MTHVDLGFRHVNRRGTSERNERLTARHFAHSGRCHSHFEREDCCQKSTPVLTLLLVLRKEAERSRHLRADRTCLWQLLHFPFVGDCNQPESETAILLPTSMENIPVDMSIHSETTTSLLREMELVYQSITSFQPTITNPPILDSSAGAATNQDGQHLYGLRPFLEAVKRDLDVVKQVLLPAHILIDFK